MFSNRNQRQSAAREWQRRSATDTGNVLRERQKISLSRERRAARTLGVIMGSVIVCWLPFFCVYLLQAWGLCAHAGLFQSLTLLGYVNSALNPLIYTVFNTDFRKSFKRILFECMLCRPRYGYN